MLTRGRTGGGPGQFPGIETCRPAAGNRR